MYISYFSLREPSLIRLWEPAHLLYFVCMFVYKCTVYADIYIFIHSIFVFTYLFRYACRMFDHIFLLPHILLWINLPLLHILSYSSNLWGLFFPIWWDQLGYIHLIPLLDKPRVKSLNLSALLIPTSVGCSVKPVCLPQGQSCDRGFQSCLLILSTQTLSTVVTSEQMGIE